MAPARLRVRDSLLPCLSWWSGQQDWLVDGTRERGEEGRGQGSSASPAGAENRAFVLSRWRSTWACGRQGGGDAWVGLCPSGEKQGDYAHTTGGHSQVCLRGSKVTLRALQPPYSLRFSQETRYLLEILFLSLVSQMVPVMAALWVSHRTALVLGTTDELSAHTHTHCLPRLRSHTVLFKGPNVPLSPHHRQPCSEMGIICTLCL